MIIVIIIIMIIIIITIIIIMMIIITIIMITIIITTLINQSIFFIATNGRSRDQQKSFGIKRVHPSTRQSKRPCTVQRYVRTSICDSVFLRLFIYWSIQCWFSFVYSSLLSYLFHPFLSYPILSFPLPLLSQISIYFLFLPSFLLLLHFREQAYSRTKRFIYPG